MKRGDVVLLDYPYADGSGSKVRPALMAQNDRDNQRLTNTIVALITKNVSRVHEPTQHQSRVTPYASSTESILTMRMPSTIVWAMSRRSNGSR